MSPSALINFSDAKSLTPSAANATRDIRAFISKAFMDDEFFQSLSKKLLEPGEAGNRQMDQALVAEAVFLKEPALLSYENLNHKRLWGHISHVLSSYGYEMKGGKVDRHLIENDRLAEPKQEVAAA